MSNSRTRIPSPARSMPLTPRRRETPRKTRSVCSPARSNASGRLSCIVREHREQAIGSFVLSPLTRRSVLTDNTDIEEPGCKSWWRDLGENSRDVMEVLKDNDVEPHNIFENIEVLSQEEKRYTLDLPDSSDSESIQSIVIPHRNLFNEKENQHQKKFSQFGTRETLEKLHKTNATAGNQTVSTATKELFESKPRSRPVFPAALLDISSNTTASEKTITAAVEIKKRIHNLFNNEHIENKKQQTKRKNMFAKFIASDSEEELPEIQPKLFALQKKSDSRRPSLSTLRGSSRGLDASLTSSMDIELDDWQLLPSSTMVDHQLNSTLTAGLITKKARLSKLSEAETCTNSSDTPKTKVSNKSISSKNKSIILENFVEKNTSIVTRNSLKTTKDSDTSKSKQLNKSISPKNITKNQQNSPQQNTSIVTRNSSKIFKDADEEIDNNRNKSQSSSNTSQSSIVTRSKQYDVANESQNASINKSKNSNKTKNASKDSINRIEGENASIKNVSKMSMVPNQDMGTDNKEIENNSNKPADNDDNELNFSLEYEDDSADEEKDANVTKNKSDNKSNEEVNASKNTLQNDIDCNKTSISNLSTKDNNVQKADKVIDESTETSGNNKSLTSKHNASEGVINNENINKDLNHDKNLEDEIQNTSQKSHDQDKETENEDENKNNKHKEQALVIKQKSDQENNNGEQNNVENDVENKDEQTEIETDQEEIEDVQNEIGNDPKTSEDEQNETENVQEESEDEQNEIEDNQEESEDDQNEIENNEEESDNELNESQKPQNESGEIQNETLEVNESESENNESQEENEDEQNVSQEEIEQNTSQEDLEQNASEVEEQQEIESEEVNESIEADSDHNDSQENDSGQEDSEQNDSDQENDMECEDANKSIEATAESDQHDEVDQIENTETPNVSHDTTGRNRKTSITPEAILRKSRTDVDLTTLRGRNTSHRKTKSMSQHSDIRLSLAPARESLAFSDASKNSSAEGSGWDSHRTTRKTLRQTFGKDFTPRKSLRALVMEKSAKRRATTANNASVTMPQANSTEFPEPELSTNDYEMDIDPPPVHEVSIRTRQATIEECLKRAKKDWVQEDAKADEIVKRRLEQGRIRIEDPFKVPARPMFLHPTSKPKPKAKKSMQSLIPLERLPKEFIDDMKYKPPKRFAPRNAAWLTKRLYKYLENKLEPKYKYKARIRAEKFAQMLYEFVQTLRRRGAPDVAAPHAVDVLKHEMARLNFVKTHFDFYNFFHEFMPREVRIKIIPDIVNKIPHPRNGVFSDIL